MGQEGDGARWENVGTTKSSQELPYYTGTGDWTLGVLLSTGKNIKGWKEPGLTSFRV